MAPAAVPEPVAADRELLLVGARPWSASAADDPITRSIVARVSLPPLDGPAGLPRRPALPKLPQPFAPDPLVLAVFLGVPLRDTCSPAACAPATGAPTPGGPTEPPAHPPIGTTAATTGAEARAETLEVPAPAGELASLKLPPDAFGALLGIPHAPGATTGAGDDLLPSAPAAGAGAAAAPLAPPTPPATPAEPIVVAVPLAGAVATAAIPPVVSLQPLPRPPLLRRPRLARRDPFARRATRRERFLVRTCMVLALALAVMVLALRLPLGSRPQLGASTEGIGDSVASAPATPTTAPFADAVRVQTRADLRVVVATTAGVYPVWQSYVPATPAVLARALPQFGFIPAARVSSRMGEISVAATAHQVVVAEFAGPAGCAFARVVGVHAAEYATSPTTAWCRGASAPAHGWIPLGLEG